MICQGFDKLKNKYLTFILFSWIWISHWVHWVLCGVIYLWGKHGNTYQSVKPAHQHGDGIYNNN